MKISKEDLSLKKEGATPLNSSAGQETSGKDAQTAVEFCNTATNCHSFLQTQCDCDETKGDSCIACETEEKCPNTTDCGKTQSNAVLCCDETVKCAIDTRNCYEKKTEDCNGSFLIACETNLNEESCACEQPVTTFADGSCFD